MEVVAVEVVVGTTVLDVVDVDVELVVVAGSVEAGATVVGATVVGATVVVVVVVGTIFRVAIALAEETFDCVSMPNWPWSLSPQQRTSPVDITAHAWLVPATTSTTVPVSPVTAPGVSRAEPIEPEPN